MKKLIMLLMALAILAGTVACSQPESIEINAEEVTPPVEEIEPEQSAEITMPDGSIMVAVGDWHVVGLCQDGSVLAAGWNEAGQCDVEAWTNILYVAAGGNDTAGITKDGTVVLAGEHAQDWADAQNWMDVARIKIDGECLAALLLDGTVTTVGTANAVYDMTSFETDMQTVPEVADGTWADAVSAASGEYVDAAVTADGTVHTAGRYADAEYLVANWNLTAAVSGQERPAAADPNEKAMNEAKNKNSDVIGYFHINHTEIDQPILWDDWSDGDWYYNNHNLDKEKTGNPGAGSVYALVSNKKQIVNTITGHNMRVSATMLHELHHVQEFNTDHDKCQGEDCGVALSNTLPDLTLYGDRVWNITAYGHSRWEVFAMYEVPHDEPENTLYYNTNFTGTINDSNLEDWIQKQIGRSEIDLGIVPTKEDDFLCIYTCGTEYGYSTAQSRLYYFLRAVD